MVLIDHSFLKSQPKYQMIVSGLDAFCQGVESFWSVNSNEESLSYSKKAICYSWTNLNKAVKGEDVLKELAQAMIDGDDEKRTVWAKVLQSRGEMGYQMMLRLLFMLLILL